MNLEEPYTGADGRCCDHGFRFNQIAEMITEGGGEARTVNLCKVCYKRLVWQGKQLLKVAEWKSDCLKRKSPTVARLWIFFGSETILCAKMWEYYFARKNQFETISGGFLELIRRFEFDFSSSRKTIRIFLVRFM